MTEQNQNILNQEHDAKMTRKFKGKIQGGNLDIGNYERVDPDVRNLSFLEKFNIQTLKIYISEKMNLKLRNNQIKELTLKLPKNKKDQVLNWNIDDFELENLEILQLQDNIMKNDQLYNIAKFKKLQTLDVSQNNVDLMHIHCVISLTKLSMRRCGLSKIDQIKVLVNLEDLDLSSNNIQNIDSIRQLVNLKALYIGANKLIDITALKDLIGLIKLNMSRCDLGQLSALKPLINLQTLHLSFNSNINITALQYLKNLTHLHLDYCNVVSVWALRPLVKLKQLQIAYNKIVDLDSSLQEMKLLEYLYADGNRVSDFTSIEKLKNFNKLDQNGYRCFVISDQTPLSLQELLQADIMRCIEDSTRHIEKYREPEHLTH
ncbi:leucine-rich_repeat domain-containing protein [Hexamita inflata]|uniref:Leucine-rich repeat domain-containing protein n=1 Tax=Hexamita inflata TaxID=28002 RepID=A0AA86PJ39_9EUKA|nr:leucine-rich repeat domain-containing protein [Hexamita inflata]